MSGGKRRCKVCKRLKPARISVRVNGQEDHYCADCWGVERAKFLRSLMAGETRAVNIFAAIQMAMRLGSTKTDD